MSFRSGIGMAGTIGITITGRMPAIITGAIMRVRSSAVSSRVP